MLAGMGARRSRNSPGSQLLRETKKMFDMIEGPLIVVAVSFAIMGGYYLISGVAIWLATRN